MEKLHLELDELEIESLEIIYSNKADSDLDSMMIGHGMLEIGASSACGDTAVGNSCCGDIA